MFGSIFHDVVGVRVLLWARGGGHLLARDRSESRDRLDNLLVDSLIMILTVTTILDIVHIVPGLKLKHMIIIRIIN